MCPLSRPYAVLDPGRVRSSNRRTPALLIALAAVTVSTAGCLEDDVGTCCEALDEAREMLIPVAPEPDPMTGQVANVIRQDPGFDCSGLTCTAYQGSAAFCTRECQETEDCPEGFECQPVLESDPGPGAMIQPGDKFCVRAPHDCTTWPP